MFKDTNSIIMVTKQETAWNIVALFWVLLKVRKMIELTVDELTVIFLVPMAIGVIIGTYIGSKY